MANDHPGTSLLTMLVEVKPEEFPASLRQHEADMYRSKRPFTDFRRSKRKG